MCSISTMKLQISLTGDRSDILLNVFLAIAVDNLADAESLTNIEKEEGVSPMKSLQVTMIDGIAAKSTQWYRVCFRVVKKRKPAVSGERKGFTQIPMMNTSMTTMLTRRTSEFSHIYVTTTKNNCYGTSFV